MKKRYTVFGLLLALVLALTPFAFAPKQSARADKNYTHYYSQLSDLAREIYDKLVDTSNADSDFSCNDVMELTDVEEGIADYLNGGSVLYDALSDAKTAIRLDCPEACFIDFDKIDLIVSQDSTGRAHAYVGAVRDNSYKLDDFVTEGVTVAEAINSVSYVVGGLVYQYDSQSIDDKIVAVNNYLMDNCDFSDSTQPFADNAYGALVMGKASSKGFASAFKLIMDNMSINCVTVDGILNVNGMLRYHSWNVVQYLSGTYIVDSALNDETISTNYLRVGVESVNNMYYPYVTFSNKVATMPSLDMGNGMVMDEYVVRDLVISAPQNAPVSDVKKPTLIEQKGLYFENGENEKICPDVLASQKCDVSVDGSVSTEAYKIRFVNDQEIEEIDTFNGNAKVVFPFPEGYGVVDEVSYKAYALGQNADGTIDYTQKTALDSVTTNYGIIVKCPIAGVVAITAEEKVQESKKVVVITGRGGKVDEDWVTLTDESVDFTVTPNANKSIESIIVNDKKLDNVVALGHAFTLKPDECGQVTVVQITFADTKVFQQNQIDGIKTAVPVTPDFDLTIDGETTFNKGESRTLTANHTAKGEVSYRWYKGSEIVGRDESVTVSDEGEYKLVVCSRVGQTFTTNTVAFTVTLSAEMTWVWILLGVLVFVLLIATIGFIYVKRAGKVDDEPKEEEVPVDTKNRIADGKTAVKVSQEMKEAKIAQELEEQRKAKEEEERLKEERAHEPLPDPDKIPVDKKEAKRIKHVTALYSKDAPWDKKVDKILKKKDKEELKKDPDAKIKRASVTSAKLTLGAVKTAKIEIQPKEEKPAPDRVATPIKKNKKKGDK